MANNKLFWIDFLRVLASFGVVLLHAGAPLFLEYGEVSDFDWGVSSFYCNSVRCRIPIFLMISGALILPKAYGSLKEYLNKRVLRIIYPFLFWSVIYLAQQLFFMHRSGELATIDLSEYLIPRLREGVSYHFWYIYVIIGLNLFFPILGKWIRNSSRNEIIYFIIMWLITIFASLPFIKTVFPNIDLQYFAGYIGFPVLGYYLMNRPYNNVRRTKNLSILLIILSSAVILAGTHIVSHRNDALYTGFLGNLSPAVILMAVGVFMLFRCLKFENAGRRFRAVVGFFSKYSYGIYLVHVLVLTLLYHLGIFHSFINPVFGIPVTAILCFVISAFIIWGINKLPFGKYISG